MIYRDNKQNRYLRGVTFFALSLIGIFSLFVALLKIDASYALLARIVHAATSFNSDPLDFPTVRVSNYTEHPDSTEDWATSTTAKPGDVISFTIYYHNTGSEDAQNVKLSLSVPANDGMLIIGSGTLWTDNAPVVSGQASVLLSETQHLTYIAGSARWYPNQTQTNPTPFPFGQTGDEFVTPQGINIGIIPPGWTLQGSVVVRFQVSQAAPPPVPLLPSVDLKANNSDGPLAIAPGEVLTLSWSSSYAAQCAFGDPINSSVGLSGQTAYSSGYPAYPIAGTSTVYTITCSNDQGTSASDSVQVSFSSPSVDITANNLQGPVTLAPSQPFTLEWTSSGVIRPCNLDIDGFGSSGIEPVGNTSPIYPGHPFYPAVGQSKTFTFSCATAGGATVSDAVVVSVLVPPITLTAQAQSCRGVAFSWYYDVTRARTFKILRDGVLIATQNATFGNNFFFDGSLNPNTVYRYQVIGNDGSTDFVSSNTETVTTPTCPPSVVPPVVPTVTAATGSQCGGSINLSWNVVSGATFYKIFRDGGASPIFVGNVNTFLDVGLSPGSFHNYQVVASNSAGNSPRSNQAAAVASKRLRRSTGFSYFNDFS
ncbi:hypothetical protein EPN83_00140 [Patescibacteria group bacterium]|nr:MAG: hypothetical protein EPN83_00140 [Patescibacteria group bacterium]